jgi:hypothetical protein
MKALPRFRPSRLTSLLLAAFAASPAYSITTYPGDPGTAGDPASWRTPEYLRSWGLRSMGAEFAVRRPATPARASRSASSIPASTSATPTCRPRASARCPSAP